MNKASLARLKSQARSFLARKRRNEIVRALANFSDRFTKLYENSNYNPLSNGEYNVLQKLSKANFKRIFDVGANVGDWALMAHGVFPQAEIHCFEIVPQTCQTLKQQTSGIANIIVNEFGLSDREQNLDIKYFPGDSTLSTTLDYPHPLENVMVRGRVVAGDGYVENLQISFIDFLKIDVEGNEARVLKGLDKTIGAGSVGVVQIEYGLANILSRFLLRDIYEFFAARDYKIGKIYPTYVDFRDYRLTDENFIGPNYLAVSQRRDDLIKLLS